jgi:ATP-dependent Lon protease
MDVIPLSGYTEEEKLGIGKKYLVPKQLKAHGLKRAQLTFTDKGLRTIIREYTREAGVRQLERQIAAVCRKAARRIAGGETEKMSADDTRVREWLGPRRFVADVRKRTSEPGVATGLAVTAVGGDVLFIEATAYPGDGRLKVTGQLGEVMQESAQAAHSWVRTHSPQLGIDPEWFGQNDVHVHIPAGAVPKDGPSAGITMATAIASVATGKPVSDEVAMTGEITLSGQVLPIGGLREKSLAAQRAGIKKVLYPSENVGDLEELPEETRNEVEFIPVDWIQEVFEVAFDGSLPHVAPARPLTRERKAAASR